MSALFNKFINDSDDDDEEGGGGGVSKNRYSRWTPLLRAVATDVIFKGELSRSEFPFLDEGANSGSSTRFVLLFQCF